MWKWWPLGDAVWPWRGTEGGPGLSVCSIWVAEQNLKGSWVAVETSHLPIP